MVGTTAEAGITGLWTKLQNSITAEKFDNGIRHSKDLAKKLPENKDVIVSQLYCMIHLNQFDAALEVMDANPKWENFFVFQRAYCLYRLFRLDEALAVASTNTVEAANTVLQAEQLLHLDELKAQILYRAEQYEVAADMYSKLCESQVSGNEHTHSERVANYYAATAGVAVSKKKVKRTTLDSLPMFDSYEANFNLACKSLAFGDFASADSQLDEALKLCKTSLTNDGFDEADVEQETAVIILQQGVSEHMKGNHKQAKNVYETILRSKPSDAVVTAVASNNLAALIGETNSHEAKKRMKTVQSAGLSNKMTTTQRLAVAENTAVLAYHLNQKDACMIALSQLDDVNAHSSASSCGFTAVVRASLLLKKKMRDEAQKLLEESRTTLEARLALAQLALGNVEGTSDITAKRECLLNVISVLSEENLAHQYPAMTGAVVALYTRLNVLESNTQSGRDETECTTTVTYDDDIQNVFKSAVAYHESVHDSVRLSTVLRGQAQFLVRSGHPEKAATAYARLLELNPNDQSSMAGLIHSYALFDCGKAEIYAQQLPAVNATANTKTAEELVLDFSSIKKTSASHFDSLSTPKIKKKRKRKGKQPKNTNAKIDPERWLPKYDRSYNKRKYKNRQTPVRGNQGAMASTAPSLTGSAGKKPQTQQQTNSGAQSSSANTPGSQVPASGGGGGSNKNKKKKKKKK
eukprot:CFRG0911T1